MKSNKIVGKGRIKLGTPIFQDHRFCKWPECCPPESEYHGDDYEYLAKDPYMIFDVEWDGRSWDCKANGYGYHKSLGYNGEYGNGSIFIRIFDGVELITENRELESRLNELNEMKKSLNNIKRSIEDDFMWDGIWVDEPGNLLKYIHKEALKHT